MTVQEKVVGASTLVLLLQSTSRHCLSWHVLLEDLLDIHMAATFGTSFAAIRRSPGRAEADVAGVPAHLLVRGLQLEEVVQNQLASDKEK